VWDPSGGDENAYWTGPQENPMNAAEGSSCIADFAGVGGFCRSADTLIDELAASGDDWNSVENAKPWDRDSSHRIFANGSVWAAGCSL